MNVIQRLQKNNYLYEHYFEMNFIAHGNRICHAHLSIVCQSNIQTSLIRSKLLLACRLHQPQSALAC